MKWTILAVKWEQERTSDPKSMLWNTLKMEVDNAVTAWTSMAGQKHPLLQPQTPPGVALYTWDQVQQFGFAAAEHAAAASSPSYAGVHCHGCGKLEHVSRHCLNGASNGYPPPRSYRGS
eukprot:1035206-Rhodomonas_salina.1